MVRFRNLCVCVHTEVQEVFSLFDKDGDGNILPRELGPVLRSLGYNPSQAHINKLMEDFDNDGGY